MLYTHNQKLLPPVQSADFLPPVSRWTSLAGIFLIASVGTAISLSSWIKYNVTVKATAAVRPTGEIRLVQPKVEGTVKSILVKENQLVQRGDAIAHLEDEQLQIKRSQLQGNIQQGKLQLIQMDAQLKTLDSQILAETTIAQRSILSAKADLARNQREYQEKQITTSSELLAAQANLEKAQADLQKAQADLSFAEVDRDRYKQLTEIGAIGGREFEQKKLVVEQTKAILEATKKSVDIAKAKVKSAKVAVNPTDATVAIAQERIAQETARGEATTATLKKEKQALLQRRVEIQNQIGQSQKELQQIATQLQDTVLRASSDGIILKLNLRNPGQVLRASEAVAEIAPNHAPLIIKAVIPTQEIKNVSVGQTAQMRIDACPYPDYGTLNGVVKAVSPDAIKPNNTNASTSGSTTAAASYFEVTIQPDSLTFGNGRQCHLQAGMEAKADIISKQETALQFILRKARLITDL
ncbi:HlyD family secretion protein [Nostoc sp. UHCC 0870]|uniref:HlyD family secretion protein n=1 Tax=Nostoc sp. UHCC 0870 TaxID=2914041 RepID=UPI001EDD9345|nr:HlyD family efflux transporter periplasmic adaptor subunit [Nostoc sp. UHCC 0870]UKO97201.1 HlyD family efflux transporter periplasmic adaptor subunit [Nostoc sp. UHCC 0870]